MNKKYSSEYYQKNKERIDKRTVDYIKNNPKGRYSNYKAQAKIREMEFTIEFNEFRELLTQGCVYCGSTGKVGIDRVDNAVGYVSGNLVSCCAVCNKMKSDRTVAEFLDQCKRIATHTP